MGLIAKHSTKRLVQDVPVAIESWASEEAANQLGLSRRQLLTAAVQKAVLETKSGSARSNWITTPGKYNSGEIAARTTSALLRCEGGLKFGDRVVLGSPSPAAQLITDWTLDVRVDGRQAVLSVGQHRTSEDEVENRQVLEHLRQRLATALSSGPVIERVPGPPDFSSLITPEVLPGLSSLFHNDYTVPVPALAGAEWSLDLPPGSADELAATFDQSGLPCRGSRGDIMREIDLGGGRQDVVTRLSLVTDAGRDRLVAHLTAPTDRSMGHGGHLRDVRALVRTLQTLASAARARAPEAADRIDAFLTTVESGNEAPDRVDRMVELWDKETPAPAMRIRRGMRLPVAIVFRTSGDYMMDTLIDAERWLLVRQRTWAKGLRRKSRDKTRFFTSRRPMVLKLDDKLQPYLRYAQAHTPTLSKYLTGSTDAAWFWELAVGSRKSDGVRSGTVAVSGLSTADDFVAYGAEMAAAMRSFCWLLQHKDPAAQIDTVYLSIGA